MSEPSIMAPVPVTAHANPPTAIPHKKSGRRVGIYDPFPMKFYRMLDQIISEGMDSIVSWLPHGRAFKIHKPKVFAATIMPRFFNQSKYTSFQRQLNLYGFSRCCRGHDAGAYHHPCFLRGRQALAKNITRTKVKGEGHKKMKLHEKDPDFYAMAALEECPEKTSSRRASASVLRLEPPTVPAPLTGCSGPSSPTPPSSSKELRIDDVSPSSDLSRQSSSQELEAGSSFVNDLNESIFFHELAMGCTILCQLRKDTSVG